LSFILYTTGSDFIKGNYSDIDLCLTLFF
jgi:hypothetical protein